MPFVPLSQRKAVPLLLDEDKEKMQRVQALKDQATIQAHVGAAPGTSGYRFAKHPQTFGTVRGPEIPFQKATCTWRPPEVQPDGPAMHRDQCQANYGAFWEASHGMRKTQSSPTLVRDSKALAKVMEACHPISQELRRWDAMAQKTEKETRKDINLDPPRREKTDMPKHDVKNGLVLFPKYMLINNCHLKMTDLQRFQRQQEAEREAERKAVTFSDYPDSDSESSGSPSHVFKSRGPAFFGASWGAPLRNGAPHWAGNGLPSGGCQKTSNPFRMG